MSSDITITREISPLERHVYVFYFLDAGRVRFATFTQETRESPRHKFKERAIYPHRRDRRMLFGYFLADIPWTPDMEAEVLEKARAMVRVINPVQDAKGGDDER